MPLCLRQILFDRLRMVPECHQRRYSVTLQSLTRHRAHIARLPKAIFDHTARFTRQPLKRFCRLPCIYCPAGCRNVGLDVRRRNRWIGWTNLAKTPVFHLSKNGSTCTFAVIISCTHMLLRQRRTTALVGLAELTPTTPLRIGRGLGTIDYI